MGFAEVAQGAPSGPAQQVAAVGAGEGGSGRVLEVLKGGEAQVKLAGPVGSVVEVYEDPSAGHRVVQQDLRMSTLPTVVDL